MSGLRYRLVADLYDVVSLEWPVYRAGRVVGVDATGLRAGDRVLDVGCGTGLSMPLVRDVVGARGAVVGVDASPQMLRRSRSRIERAGWTNVQLIRADAADPPPALRAGPEFDAVLFVYALSVVADWRRAWYGAIDLLRPGGRATIVDLALPTDGWRVLSPAARLACLAGGSDPHRHPWKLLEAGFTDVGHEVLRGGHVHVVSGRRSG
ncbi:class I SAM-dependent methyltransferase [Micromonospora marina]|uniref:Ubiquinone/menaquinone biosynthesis C-methylase UbiE n=1 Tax=Micromonospora marina TaxID=307120 RepID=A0A1C4XX29_9ACTN|nr:methyltransferase domain-containing protein [Micromonospora marina]SCF13005.1 Ubiquinone/menaquinone biosynthesis C-methylase UbiE [Micromonospora marina]